MSNNPMHLKEWDALKKHAEDMAGFSISDAFDSDNDRFEALSASVDGLLFDYSKQKITQDTLSFLIKLAKAMKLEQKRDDMFAGKPINHTEGRAVLHTALRDTSDKAIDVDGENIKDFIGDTLKRMESFTASIHKAEHKGFTGKAIKSVVSIGIGGSDLGPRMAVEALKPFHVKNIETYFVANVDGADIHSILSKVDAETTLFIVASKTFTTQETLTNAETAKSWLIENLGDTQSVEQHFVALSTNIEGAKAFDINTDNVFPFGNWVGGRFSLWSVIGLSIMLSIGAKNFRALLDGAQAMDTHFATAPLESNIPALLALIGVWNRNFLHCGALAILPYAQDLASLPLFLQQLEMESNGKYIDSDGQKITDYQTCPVLFGQAGTNGQHAFYQLLHQGTNIIPSDFIGFKNPQHPYNNHHDLLNTNMIAQSQALMKGRTSDEADGNPHRVFEGNRPNSTLIFKTLDPYHLGMLIALYEHKVFVQGVIWNINSFDQFGVELGKEMAKSIESGKAQHADASTSGLLSHIKAQS